eukprot:TRINITY_DN348_c1_g1_i2.p1 TRINITY_DN348_c1_g1~~TRINITY_DN348_c1_g1_i2.p1  ORF type:complete len:266 (-),score=32.91 TRINITY_DN348_c1_g1_i2:86-883(-)
MSAATQPNDAPMNLDEGHDDDQELVPFLTKSGDVYQFDCSAKSCAPKGFLSGERVLTPKGPATVVGVNGGFLWFKMDGDKGASYWNNGCTYEDLLRLGIQHLNPSEPYDPKRQFRGLKRPGPKFAITNSNAGCGPSSVNNQHQHAPSQHHVMPPCCKEIEGLKQDIAHLRGQELESLDFHELEQLERVLRESHEKVRSSLVERIEDKMKNFMCVVCMDTPFNVCCLPCGHVSICVGCSFKIGIGGQCPTCRKPIEQLCRVYLQAS